MRLTSRAIVASLFTVKIVVGSFFIYQMSFDGMPWEGSAIASEQNVVAAEKAAHDDAGVPASHKSQAFTDSGTADRQSPAMDEELDLEFLKKRESQLEKREEDIEKKKNELLAIQDDITRKIAILTQLRDEIRAEMERRKTLDEMKLRHIVKAYSAMKPQKAAGLIEKLDIDFAIELLSNMKGDIVGDILSFLDTQKAAKISEKLVKKE
jgi:flagellar motility protein MotE (MotC chaperone)